MPDKTGKTTLYWPKGLYFWKSPPVYAAGEIKEGKRHGEWVFWYKTGTRQLEGTYLNDKKHGLWIKWWEGGGKWAEGICVHGKMDGKWMEWHRNGEKSRESYWVVGKKDGRWTYWRPDGTVDRTETYDYRTEPIQDRTVCTDLEARRMVRQIQREALHRNWEKMVGKSIASLIKPWHIACWVLIFVVGLGLAQDGSKVRAMGLAAILALSVTSLLVWLFDGKGR